MFLGGVVHLFWGRDFSCLLHEFLKRNRSWCFHVLRQRISFFGCSDWFWISNASSGGDVNASGCGKLFLFCQSFWSQMILFFPCNQLFSCCWHHPPPATTAWYQSPALPLHAELPGFYDGAAEDRVHKDQKSQISASVFYKDVSGLSLLIQFCFYNQNDAI